MQRAGKGGGGGAQNSREGNETTRVSGLGDNVDAPRPAGVEREDAEDAQGRCASDTHGGLLDYS